MSELTARQEEYLDALPQPSYQAWADAVGASESSAEEMRRRLTDENDDIEIEKVDGEGDAFENVNFRIGQARPYTNFPLRGGKLRGHLRHGQDRKPQATRAGSDDWKTTLMNHDFDGVEDRLGIDPIGVLS